MPGGISKRLPPARCMLGMGRRSGACFVWQLPHAATTFTRYSPRASNAPESAANADWESVAAKATVIRKADISPLTLTIAQFRSVSDTVAAKTAATPRRTMMTDPLVFFLCWNCAGRRHQAAHEVRRFRPSSLEAALGP